MLAWLFARSTGRGFVLRIDDLDRVRPGAEQRQIADLAAIGLDWDGPVVRQTERSGVYTEAIERLIGGGLTYECYCTRREIQQAASAPHAPQGAYPGTCRGLTDSERTAKRAEGRPPALRLRAAVREFTIVDELHGRFTGLVDDLVLRRGDGTTAYNLAVVVDDADQRVDQVVRGDDLLSSTPRQAYLAEVLDLPSPTYAHVPLALNETGRRLAKRDGPVTLSELIAGGQTAGQVLETIAASLGLVGTTPHAMLDTFDPRRLPTTPWVVST